MITVAPGQYNMSTLAGLCADMCAGYHLPLELKVVACFYDEETIKLSEDIPNVEQIRDYLRNKQIPVRISSRFRGMTVALPRSLREDENILTSAKVCTFVLLCLHETIVLHAGNLGSLYPED